MENEFENINSSNDETTEEVADTLEETTTEAVEDTTEEVDVEALKAQNKKLFERAKKAEAETKKLKQVGVKKEEEPSKPSLSAKDIIAIRDLHEEDAEYLLEESQLRRKPLSDLKKDPYYKAILQVRAEERKSAEATHSGKSRSGTSKLTSEQIVEMSRSGKQMDGADVARAEFDLLRSKK